MRQATIIAAVLAVLSLGTGAVAVPPTVAEAHEFDYDGGCQNLTPGVCEDLFARGLTIVHCYRQFYGAPIYQEGKGCGPRADDGFTSWESFTFEGPGGNGGHGYFVSVQPASGARDGRGYDIVSMNYKDYRGPGVGRWSSVTYNCFPLSGICAEDGRSGGRLPFER